MKTIYSKGNLQPLICNDAPSMNVYPATLQGEARTVAPGVRHRARKPFASPLKASIADIINRK